MLHVDLCCGRGGWQAPFEDSACWRSVGVDVRDDLDADVVGDVRRLPLPNDLEPTLLTMSPPCTQFARWMLPWCDEPDPDLSLVRACLQAVETLAPEWWVLENSRGLHQFWRESRTHVGAFYLWGEFPAFDVERAWVGKMQTSGEKPEKRAEVPYPLADALRQSVEWSSTASPTRAVADGGQR